MAQAVREADVISAIEFIAFLLGIAYLLLAIRESIWCWICALISSSIFAILFARAQIYMDAALQLFYVAMALYGWRQWRGGAAEQPGLQVARWAPGRHAVAIAGIMVASAIAGYLLDAGTDAKYPYVDSATTFASFWATFLVARKVLENWWYWLAIDSVSIVIYLERGLEFAALLFVIYVVMIPFGLISWTRSYRHAATETAGHGAAA